MQQEYFGMGSITFLKEILERENPSKIFLVRGKQAYVSSGVQKKLEPFLFDYEVVHFSDFSVNPRIEDVEKGIELYKKEKCDFVIAVGGGSVIDMAKSINVLSVQPEEPPKYILKELPIEMKGNPLIAIPTTSGTGTEATQFAVVYIGKKKYSLAHKEILLPSYVILDPSLTSSLPAKVTASTAMDALAQAIEAHWSVHSTRESKIFSRGAISLILDNVHAAVNSPTEEARIAMMKGSNLAGKAINIAKTTACHAVSYPITSYFNIPHGHAVALTLGEMFVFNAQIVEDQCSDKRGVGYVKDTMYELIQLFKVETAQEVRIRIEQLMDSIQLERNLSKLHITTEDHFNLIIQNGFNPERVKNNPRLLTEQNLRSMLTRIK